MRKHELHCTKNPDRECRVCKMVEGEQKPIAELVALLPDVVSHEDDYGNVEYHEGTIELLNAALPKLRDACTNCPACIMAAIRQKGIHVHEATDFDFTKEMQSLWGTINQRQNEPDYYFS